jgi:hypothetical protein
MFEAASLTNNGRIGHGPKCERTVGIELDYYSLLILLSLLLFATHSCLKSVKSMDVH